MGSVYCVIMAGGKGERFWPVSTDEKPKPFIKLLGDKTLIQHTFERALQIAPKERIYVVLGDTHVTVAKEQLPQLEDKNFLIEPAGRDTAPCIGYAAKCIAMESPDAIMVTLPADHYVPDVEEFVRTIKSGIYFAGSGSHLVTIGITPTRPETGYGYIEAAEPFGEFDGFPCYSVGRFVEKPDFDRAVRYISEGIYYWNGGIFIWQVKTLLAGLEQHTPELVAGLDVLEDAICRNDEAAIKKIFEGFPRVSIDYALMEKADNVLVIPSKFVWDDVGTWASLARAAVLDACGNYIVGTAVLKDVRDCVVCGDGVTVGVLGVDNIVVVATPDGVLVCDKGRSQEVRDIARMIGERKK